MAAVSSAGVPATFAAGCYWGTERYFKRNFKNAILSGAVGFMGGDDSGATVAYKDVCTGKTGHAEVYDLTYDPTQTTYEELVHFFFRMHNPCTLNRQQNDSGTQYRSAIFYHNDEQKKVAEAFIAKLNGADPELHRKLIGAFGEGSQVVTRVERATTFFPAEEHHQQYLEKNPDGYCSHRIYW